MDQMMGDGGRFPLETWFWEMPICTRWWTTATVLTSALVQCQMVTPFQLFYSFRAVFAKSQVGASRSLSLPALKTQVTNVFVFLFAVLASSDNLSLLRALLPRSPLSRLLPTAIRPTSGGIFRPFARSFLMAPGLRHDQPATSVPAGVNAISWPSPVINSGLHMVATEPGYAIELSGPVGFHSSIPSLGSHGL